MREGESEYAFSLSGITKKFGSVVALDNISLSVPRGTIHAVVGENGAGKTTLMRVLYGAILPDSGSIEIDGKAVKLANSAAAISHGVGMVSQHYAIIPELTNLQNLILGSEGSAILKRNDAEERATELAKSMDFAFDWATLSESLSPAAAQKLEILKLLWRSSKILILDEPTAMLSPADGEALFRSLRVLVDRGATVVLVTHRIPEVLAHCQRVTVLRGGKWIAERAVSDVSAPELAELIIGKSLRKTSELPPLSMGAEVFSSVSLSVKGDRGNLAVKDVSFAVRKGEILGIAGVDGSGQRELFHAILGTRGIVSGDLLFKGASIKSDATASRLAGGIRIIAEDRLGEGAVEEWPLEENSTLGLQRDDQFSRRGNVLRAERTKWTALVADRFSTKRASIRQNLGSLSGGNQQRFVVGRATESSPKFLIAFQPTRGLDLNASAEIFESFRDLAKSGVAVLLVSYDLDDLMAHCDRIAVMNRGILREPTEKTREAIGRLMVDE